MLYVDLLNIISFKQLFFIICVQVVTTRTSLSQIRREFAPSFVNYKKGALDSQPQVIKFTSFLPRVGGSPRVLRLPPLLKLVAMI